MKLIEKRLDYATPWELPNVYLFTGNPIRRNDGHIVMGRGAAKQVRDTYPGIGRMISTERPVTFTQITDRQFIGWFQVKHHWKDAADLDLITTSAAFLDHAAKTRPEVTFHMNFPGIGNGKLQRTDVEPILNALPDNVHVYI